MCERVLEPRGYVLLRRDGKPIINSYSACESSPLTATKADAAYSTPSEGLSAEFPTVGAHDIESPEPPGALKEPAAYVSDRRSPTRARTDRGKSLRPLVVILGLKVFDVIAPLILGFGCYKFLGSADGATFWEICGKVSIVAAVLAGLIFHLAGCYRLDQFLDRERLRPLRTLATAFWWLLVIGFTTAFLSKSLNDVSRNWATLWILTWVIAAAAARLYAVHAVLARAATGQMAQTIAVVGATAWAEHVCEQILKQDQPGGVRIVGVFDDRKERVTARFAGSARTVDDLLELGTRVHIDRIVLALPLHAEARILAISDRLMALSVDILACPDVSAFNLLQRPVSSQAGLPAIQISSRPISEGQLLLKGALDKIFALGLLVLISPLLLAIAAAIALDSPGPVLFRQPRHGYNNRKFDVLKFRSMRVDLADTSGARQAQRNDSRVTRLGKFLRRSSLDELPQLFNVLRGDMSLVGPRPLPVGMRTQDLSNHEIVERYAHRHRVRPGITGWAQVQGYRGATEIASQLQKRVELDMFYIENWSLMLDLKILFMTALHLVTQKNAF